LVVPSAYLAAIAGGWGLPAARLHVLTNPAPPPLDVAAEPLGERTLVFAGRLTVQKGLDVLLDALHEVPAAELVLVGDGPERSRLEHYAVAAGVAGRVRFAGALPRDEVLRLLAGARAAVLSSDWENLPHAAVEALAVGTPVVSTAVGGVPEVVHDGENGLLVPARDPAALAGALCRVLDEPALRERLAAGTRPSVEAISRERIYERLEALLGEAAR
jgi:glycosyltransferase involved in cell wall biosynthesis